MSGGENAPRLVDKRRTHASSDLINVSRQPAIFRSHRRRTVLCAPHLSARSTAPGIGFNAGANARASLVLPVPERPPMATNFGAGGVMACRAKSKYARAARAMESRSDAFAALQAGGGNPGADRCAHRQEERQRRQCLEVLDPPRLRQVAVEHYIGGMCESALQKVHQQKREVVKDIAGRDNVAEFDGVKQNRLAVDQRDIAEMKVAMDAPDKAAARALVKQRDDALIGLAAFDPRALRSRRPERCRDIVRRLRRARRCSRRAPRSIFRRPPAAVLA